MSPLILALLTLPAAASTGDIAWQAWDDAVFQRAQAQQRFVLLDLGAVWCHWCHVMEETTYRDPIVVQLVRERFLPVRVDQDQRPDLSNRYEDYGWPATVIFDARGQELAKFSGYIPPPRMRSLLQGVIDDPTPGPSVRPEAQRSAAPETALAESLRSELAGLLVSRYDAEHGGWGFAKKFLDWDSVEWSLRRAREGDRDAERRALETLDRQTRLIDPVWGGVYQYSDGGVWENPHFEKIMQFQAENLRIFSQAYAQTREPRYLQAARDVDRYLRSFLRDASGAFYVSQDADLVPGEHSAEYFALGDVERRRLGVPRVDTHLYTRENGWAAHALVWFWAVSGDESALADARAAARWIVANRALPDGGYRHDAQDAGGPYMGDTVAAGRAFLSLYSATGEREWLARAEDAARFVGRRFRADGEPGFVSAAATAGLAPKPQRDENVLMARLSALLWHFSGRDEHLERVREAMRYLAAPDVARRFSSAAVLLADDELLGAPLHVTIVGRREDPRSRELVRAALAHPDAFKRVELWDPRDGPLPRADVDYPSLETAAAFVCRDGRCAAPLTTAEALAARLAR
jgi:uncharacterized protein YyaL (SSP411 family)